MQNNSICRKYLLDDQFKLVKLCHIIPRPFCLIFFNRINQNVAFEVFTRILIAVQCQRLYLHLTPLTLDKFPRKANSSRLPEQRSPFQRPQRRFRKCKGVGRARGVVKSHQPCTAVGKLVPASFLPVPELVTAYLRPKEKILDWSVRGGTHVRFGPFLLFPPPGPGRCGKMLDKCR